MSRKALPNTAPTAENIFVTSQKSSHHIKSFLFSSHSSGGKVQPRFSFLCSSNSLH